MNKTVTSEVFLNKYWRLLISLVVIVLALAGYFYVVKADIDNWYKLKAQALVDLKNQIAESQIELINLAKVKKSYDVLAAEQQTNLSRLSQILPTSISLPQLVVQLEGLARQSGFSLNDINFASSQAISITNEPNNDHVKALTVNVALSGPGDYQNLKKLLTNIEQHIRLLDLLSLSLSSQSQTSQANGQGYALQFRTYYWQP